MNTTSNDSLVLYNQQANMYIMEHRIVKFLPSLAYEIIIYLNKSSGKTDIYYRELNLDMPAFKLVILGSIGSQNSISLYIAREMNVNFEICNETIAAGQKILFRLSNFNKSTTTEFRKEYMFTINNSSMTDQ